MAPDDQPMTITRCHGFSLIELLLAGTAGLLLLALAAGTLSDLRRGFVRQQERSARQQDLRVGLTVLASELRLAGLGMSRAGRPLLSAESSALSFFANLSSRTTQLTRDLAPSDRALAVRDGRGWRKGKQVLLCTAARCLRRRLARDGRRSTLELTRPPGVRVPSESQILLANHVGYHHRRDADGGGRLMRRVDGGISTVVEDVAEVRFSYFGPDGAPADEAGHISRVRIEIASADGLDRTHRDVAVGW